MSNYIKFQTSNGFFFFFEWQLTGCDSFLFWSFVKNFKLFRNWMMKCLNNKLMKAAVSRRTEEVEAEKARSYLIAIQNLSHEASLLARTKVAD